MDKFHDEYDRLKYLDILRKVKHEQKFELYAYCLMRNHVHLLLKETDSEISDIMKSINIRFAMYFNKKYDRLGNLFQDRFLSETIDSESQFLNCARYIHYNPVKAGIVTGPQYYRWSSLQGYLEITTNPLINKEFMLGLLDEDPVYSRNQLLKFTCEANCDSFIDYELDTQYVLLETNKIVDMIRVEYEMELRDVKSLEKKKRNAVIKYIKENTSLSYRELAEMLNVSKYIISRAK